jgi:MSHA biogenesis protein MshI
MRFFGKRKKPGWLVLAPSVEGASVVYVSPSTTGAKPVVQLCAIRQEQLSSDAGVETLAKALHLKDYRCSLLLSQGDYLMLQVEAPNVPAEELRQAVRWRLKDLIDYPVEQATVDVLDIPSDPNNPGRANFMYAVVAKNELVAERINRLMGKGGIPLKAIDIPEMAQRNVAALLEDAGRGLAMLSFSQTGGLLTFTAGGELYHARHVDTGLQQLMTQDEEQQSRIFDRVALELQRSLDNFERQFPHIGINRLLLAPFPAREAFREFTASYLGLKVDAFDLADVFDISAVQGLDDLALQAKLFGALGAALRGGAA